MSDDPADLSAEADELLAALAAASGGEGMISARQDASNMLVSTGPDVLWTPMGGGDQAVPYPTVVAKMDTSERLSMSVRNNGNYDFQLNSRTTYIQGHHKGVHKGVVVPGYEKYSHALLGADYLFSEGFANVSHQDPAWINHPDLGPKEPQREMADAYIADVSDHISGQSTSPYGGLPTFGPSQGLGTPDLLTNPNPSGPAQSFSPTAPSNPLYDPHAFSPLTPQQQQQQYDDWLNSARKALKKRRTSRRRGNTSNRSRHRSNAAGRANMYATFDQIAPALMAELMRKYNLSADQAAGWVGNLGAESRGFNAVVEQDPIAGPGGAGYGQWTGPRRIKFEKYIKQQTGHDATPADYRDFNLNRGYLESEIDHQYAGVMNDVQDGGPGPAPGITPGYAANVPQPWTSNIAGADNTNLANSTWKVYGEYETPADYIVGHHGNASETMSNGRVVEAYSSYRSRIRWAERAKQDYQNSIGPTGGGGAR